ncbi:MAG: hypothetical protein D6801_03030 [Alphaproteobacteria bacterium]|nr:MAG: hypothetical protein D6801_03030 [Alphaproteobacteria bacterium]
MRDALIVIAILASGAVLFLPRLRHAPVWRAMVTPLASIIGSGFLVLGPILDHAYGAWAPAAMLALCAVAWSFGGAIRFNIAYIGETLDPGEQPRAEAFAALLLGFAYMISVAYYLNLFGAFAVSLTPWDTPLAGRLVTTAIYALLLVVGWRHGFRALETMEYASVAVKLAIISGLLVGLAGFTWGVARSGGLDFSPPQVTGLEALTLGFGLIITVQGFETSRYLSQSYAPGVRIASMRLAQGVATLIYLVYILLLAYSFGPGEVPLTETAIIDMMALVSPVMPAFLVAAALAAQFSAAVADTSGSGGLISETSGRRIAPRQAYAVTVAIGLALTWTADVFEIIAHASRAFAAYYAAQSALAAWRAAGRGRPALAVWFAALALLGVAITLFGTPVEA